MAALGEVRGDDPFEAVAGGAPEEQHCLEVFVLQKFPEEFLNVREVVEIQAKEAGVVEEFVFPADGESAREGTVVEFLGFEHPGSFGVADETELLCAAAGVSAGDVTPGIEEGYLLVGRDVSDRGLEEGEVRLRDERGLEEDAAGLLFSKVEVKFVVEDLQEFVAGFLVEEFGKVQEGAVGDMTGGVVMPGDAVAQPCARIDFLHPDVQARSGVVPGVTVPAAVVTGYPHQEVGRVELPEDVGIYIGSVERLGDDVLFGESAVHVSATFPRAGPVVGNVGLGDFGDVVGVDGTAVGVPADDGALDEEEALSALDVGNLFFGYPAVDGLDGGLFGKEGRQFLNGHFVVRGEVLRLEPLEEAPEGSEVIEHPGCRERQLFFGNGLEGSIALFKLFVKGACLFGFTDDGLVQDEIGWFLFGHNLTVCVAALFVPWRLGG